MIERTSRETKGQAIANLEGQINRFDAKSYKVKSQSGNGEYEVLNTQIGWICSCPDHMYRGVKCKHVWAVEFSLKMREQVSENLAIQPLSTANCVFCGSENIVKNAIRHNKYGDIQRYLCKSCEKRFSVNIGFEKMKASPQVITSAMQLYFTGESLRNVQKFLKLQGVKVSHVTILKWIRKYTRIMENYLEKLKPNVSDTWRADEIYMKIKGNMKYLFAMMDDETRFWIAQEVAETKTKHDARILFFRAKRLMGKQPKTLITDGLPTYSVSCEQVFDEAKHIRHITLKGDRNNNKMERLNGEIRDREKTMRGLKKRRTTILRGYQIYHNYVRPHEGLDGKTPAEACGMRIKGDNKWITLIQNASQKK